MEVLSRCSSSVVIMIIQCLFEVWTWKKEREEHEFLSECWPIHFQVKKLVNGLSLSFKKTLRKAKNQIPTPLVTWCLIRGSVRVILVYRIILNFFFFPIISRIKIGSDVLKYIKYWYQSYKILKRREVIVISKK